MLDIFPPDDPEMEAALGRFMITWGALERELDHGMSVVLDVHGPLALCVSANLGTKSKLDILRSAFFTFYCDHDCDAMDHIHALLDKIGDLSGRVRNTAAHGQPVFHPALGDNHPERWTWARYSARKTLNGRYDDFGDTAFWNAQTEAVREIIVEFVRACDAASEYVLSLTPKTRVSLFGHSARDA
mgnify:CR=1 FL=1